MNVQYPEDRKKRMPSPEIADGREGSSDGVDLSLVPTCSSRDITSGKRKLYSDSSPTRVTQKKTKLNADKKANKTAQNHFRII